MKLKVLVDNNTYIDEYYLGEPAVSYYLEDGDKRILFDTGYSDVFIKNAASMDIDLAKLHCLVLSHGHNDHTGGLSHLLKENENNDDLTIIAHPHTFEEKRMDDIIISSPLSLEEISKNNTVITTKTPFYITDKLIFLGEIPRVMDYEAKAPVGIRNSKEGLVEDYVLDDSALVFTGEEGIYIITGCSHAGICNIIEYSKKVTQKDKVLGIIGGFHLFDVNEQVEKTREYLKEQNIPYLYPCHCTSFKVKASFLQELNIEETGVGLALEWI